MRYTFTEICFKVAVVVCITLLVFGQLRLNRDVGFLKVQQNLITDVLYQ